MAGTELGQPRAIDRVEPQRSKLAAALQRYEVAVMNPEPGWSDGVGAPLGLLRDAFDEHVEFTEGAGGLFEEMLDEAAEVTSEIDQLRRDHIMVVGDDGAGRRSTWRARRPTRITSVSCSRRSPSSSSAHRRRGRSCSTTSTASTPRAGD